MHVIWLKFITCMLINTTDSSFLYPYIFHNLNGVKGQQIVGICTRGRRRGGEGRWRGRVEEEGVGAQLWLRDELHKGPKMVLVEWVSTIFEGLLIVCLFLNTAIFLLLITFIAETRIYVHLDRSRKDSSQHWLKKTSWHHWRILSWILQIPRYLTSKEYLSDNNAYTVLRFMLKIAASPTKIGQWCYNGGGGHISLSVNFFLNELTKVVYIFLNELIKALNR